MVYSCFICGIYIMSRRLSLDGSWWLQRFRVRKSLCLAASPTPTFPLILNLCSGHQYLGRRVYSFLGPVVYGSLGPSYRPHFWCRHQHPRPDVVTDRRWLHGPRRVLAPPLCGVRPSPCPVSEALPLVQFASDARLRQTVVLGPLLRWIVAPRTRLRLEVPGGAPAPAGIG
jgi:hypothetical protein